jgi:hypothetical protein
MDVKNVPHKTHEQAHWRWTAAGSKRYFRIKLTKAANIEFNNEAWFLPGAFAYTGGRGAFDR